MIFTRRRFNQFLLSNIILNKRPIYLSSSVTYRGLIFDLILGWISQKTQLSSLFLFTCALHSTLIARLEVKCSCPPLEIKSHHLVSKFLFKFPQLFSLPCPNWNKSWRFVPRSLSILASISSSFLSFNPIII